MTGRAMRERGIVAGGENGGPEKSVADHDRTERVDTAVHTMQSPPLDAVSHRARTEPERYKLAKRHHAVLPAGEPRDRHIHRGWHTSRPRYRRFVWHPPSVGDRALRVSAFCEAFVTIECPGWDSNPHAPRGKGF